MGRKTSVSARWAKILFGKDSVIEEEQKEQAQASIVDKVRGYVDKMPDMADVSEFRAATAKAIAAHNEMKLEAREHGNQELFDFLMPFSEYFLKCITSAAFESAQNKAVEVELDIRCEDEKDPKHTNFYHFEDRESILLSVGSALIVNDVTYKFDDAKSQWQYFYQFVDWLREELANKGLSVALPTKYGRIGNDGWNSAMDHVSLILRWGDDVFIDAVKKFDDASQVDAYLAGVPIEDIVA